MSATSSSSDKYLFLFTTDDDALGPVKTALQGNYLYPAGNTFEVTGCTNFESNFSTLLKILVPVPNSTFKEPDPAGKVPDGETPQNTLVIIISGDADSNGLKDSSGGNLTWTKLLEVLSGVIRIGLPKTYNYQTRTEVHIVFLSPYCNTFLSACIGNTPISNGTFLIPQTILDQYTTTHQTLRNSFLADLANQLNLNTATPLDEFGRISFNDIASSLLGGNPGNDFFSSSGNFFPGYSWFEIADSNPVGDSPDMKMINPQGTGYEHAYVVDTGGSHLNKVEVHATLNGTHPAPSFTIDIGVFRDGEIIGADDCSKKDSLPVPGLISPGDLGNHQLGSFVLDADDCFAVVARATIRGDDTFDDAAPQENDFEAILYIASIPPFSCITSHTDAASASSNDGSIKFTPSHGVAPYYYKIDNSAFNDFVANGSCNGEKTFSPLAPLHYTVHAKDSSIGSWDGEETVDVQTPTVQCSQLFDNRYIHICRTLQRELRFTFKKYPDLTSGYYRARLYKIRWKTGLQVSSGILLPNDLVSFRNIDVVASGTTHNGQANSPYVVLRVPASLVGEMLIKPPKSGWPYNKIRIEIPVRIYFKRAFGLWPRSWWPWHWPWRWPWEWRLSWPWHWPYPWRWPWLWPWSHFRKIAKFKFVIFDGNYDIIEY